MTRNPARRRLRALTAGALAVGALSLANPAWAAPSQHHHHHGGSTATPIKHLVVIFDENVSFDHYFGTYPKAANTDGTRFTARRGTRTPTNLLTSGLLKKNPNQYAPQRLTHGQALTCDQNHGYAPEQQAFDGGRMDLFVQKTESDKCDPLYGTPGLVMDYYDGNTVTGLWNYAQHYAMSDNSYGSTFGPSTPGAVNLVSGQTHGAYEVASTAKNPSTAPRVTAKGTVASPNAKKVGTLIGDVDPAYDDCSDNGHTASSNLGVMTGRNIGDLLNAKHVTWGWFQGGFRPSSAWTGSGYAKCATAHQNVGGASVVDYSPHHEPFQYYASTANPHHLPPSSVSAIGHTDQANHQYDLTDFDSALAAHDLPSVSFLKAPAYQDGHAGYSDPLDEQTFLTTEINKIEHSKDWKDTAVVVSYDDSDGWYDQATAVTNGSHDASTDSAVCTAVRHVAGGYQDRCGPGPRLPLLVISPYSRVNTIAHNQTEQASITRFIEDNWRTGRIGDASFDQRAGSLLPMFDFRRPRAQRVYLDPKTGAVVRHDPTADPTVHKLPAVRLAASSGDGTTVTAAAAAGAAVLAGAGAYLVLLRRRRW